MDGGDTTDQQNDTTRELGVGPSDGFDLCVVPAPLRSSVSVSRPGGAPGASGVWSILLRTQERGMRSTVNVYDESVLLDNPEYKFLEPMLKEIQGQGEALPLLNLRDLCWTTVCTTAACNLRFERFGPPVLYQSRHGGASHEVFTAFRNVTGMHKRGL